MTFAQELDERIPTAICGSWDRITLKCSNLLFCHEPIAGPNQLK